MRVRSLAAVTFLVAALGISSQTSADLIVNGGFETGDFTGWSLAGNSGFISITTNAHSGQHAASFGAIGSDTNLSQTQNLSTTAGATYVLSYWLTNLGGPTNDFSVDWGGSLVTGSSLLNAQPFAYTQFSFDVVATSAMTALQFNFRQDPSSWNIDDISVNAVAVPEPSTLAIGGVSGLLALAYGLRRRKQSA